MLRILPQLLKETEVESLLELAGQGDFEDGRATAGQSLHDVKQSEQLRPSQELTPRIQAIVTAALDRSAEFQHFALPKRMLLPRICRYREGGGYGSHFDSPIMQVGREAPLRTDLSISLFLTPPESYRGGELCMETPFGEQQIKLPAGDAVVYATTVRHRVAPVTEGARVVVISWIQSLVKDPIERETLGDLYRAADLVKGALPGSEASELILKIKTAVFKAWADV